MSTLRSRIARVDWDSPQAGMLFSTAAILVFTLAALLARTPQRLHEMFLEGAVIQSALACINALQLLGIVPVRSRDDIQRLHLLD